MASDSEPAKLLLPFLQRADELQKHEPLVTYYCRLYAMEKGLKIPQKERTKTSNALLISLMNQLEKDKKTLKLGAEDYLYLEGFASNVFTKADKQDRAGRADLSTAKTFYAASIFFEILNQFGELSSDIEQRLKYAIWKAADIRKALKEGRKPEPGPPGGDKDLLLHSSPTNALDSDESTHTNFISRMPSGQTEQDMDKGESSNYFGASFPSQDVHKVLGKSESINYSGANFPPKPADKDLGQRESFSYSGTYVTSPNAITSPSYPSKDYSSDHQQFSYEQQPSAQNYSQENHSPSYSYQNFQSYPSFQESPFPSAPTQQPTYYHGADSPHFHESSIAPLLSNYHTESLVSSSASYKYESNYQPPVEKISEAHKVARFAVGALAFDDVPVAVDYLRRSLELLTNPSAETH